MRQWLSVQVELLVATLGSDSNPFRNSLHLRASQSGTLAHPTFHAFVCLHRSKCKSFGGNHKHSKYFGAECGRRPAVVAVSGGRGKIQTSVFSQTCTTPPREQLRQRTCYIYTRIYVYIYIFIYTMCLYTMYALTYKRWRPSARKHDGLWTPSDSMVKCGNGCAALVDTQTYGRCLGISLDLTQTFPSR